MNSIYKKNNDLNPIGCLNMPFEQSIDFLKKYCGEETFKKAMDINSYFPSIVSQYTDTSWTKTLKMVGINPRITKTFWGIVKYAISFPENGIHIMPIFETGDGSIYVQNSWELNNDFLDNNLYKLGYKTANEQLKLIINVLHAMGKIVGFDALPHCDNFSEIVLTNPKLFEWIKLNNNKTDQISYNKIDHNILYKEVESIIIKTLKLPQDIFTLAEEIREAKIFPKNIDKFQRRMELRNAIREEGFEPLPVVEHAPNRPIFFKNIVNDNEKSWATFFVKGMNNHAKVFGALTPYKLYYIDRNGYPQKNSYWVDSWDYFSDKIKDIQKEYNFDFLRADMAHNQISHSHNENEKDLNCPELWAYVKNNIQEEKPYFATIAEAFWGTYYIDGITDMINKNFDIILGDMNYKILDKNYLDHIDDYINPFRQNFSFSPCIAVYTNDSDIENNNYFYESNKQNLSRYFISMFLNLPSYTGMGYELRDINPKNKNNYSNYYVKKQQTEYQFGNNTCLYREISRIRNQYKKLKNIIDNCELNLVYSLNNQNSLCFKYLNKKNSYLFIINIDKNINTIELNNKYKNIKIEFTSDSLTKLIIKEETININIETFEYAIFAFEE